jgi:integration host factor subunit beta
MTKCQLIECIAEQAPHVPRRQVEALVEAVFDVMGEALKAGQRIELRGFGVFTVRVRDERTARNPKTGVRVSVPRRRTLAFAAGKTLRERIQAVALKPSEPTAPPPRPVPELPPPPPASLQVQARI